MLGLIIKDLYSLKKTLITMLLLFVFYVVFGITADMGSSMLNIMTMLAPLIAISSFYYDDMNKWDNYAMAMPLTRRQIVTSKYALSLLLMAVSAALSSIFNVVFYVFGLDEQMGMSFTIMGVFALIGVLFVSIVMPLIYKFGLEKGRLLMMGCGILIGAAAALFASSFEDRTIQVLMDYSGWILAGAVVLILVSAALSLQISVKLYEKKAG